MSYLDASTLDVPPVRHPTGQALDAAMAARIAAGQVGPQPDVVPSAADVFDPTERTVADVLEHVGDDEGRAQSALDLERQSDNPRSSLIKRLDEMCGVE